MGESQGRMQDKERPALTRALERPHPHMQHLTLAASKQLRERREAAHILCAVQRAEDGAWLCEHQAECGLRVTDPLRLRAAERWLSQYAHASGRFLPAVGC